MSFEKPKNSENMFFILNKTKTYIMTMISYFEFPRKRKFCEDLRQNVLKESLQVVLKEVSKRALCFIVSSFKHVGVCKVPLSIQVKFNLKSICFQRSLCRF